MGHADPLVAINVTMEYQMNNQQETPSSQSSIIHVNLEDDSTDQNISSAKKLTKKTGPFSVQDLSHLLKTSAYLRAQIFPSSHSADVHDDEDEFTIKPISSGYVSHAFIFEVNDKSIKASSRSEFFIKINRNKHAKQMFDAETMGLNALQQACLNLVRVPQSIATGYLSESDHDQGGWLLLEFIPMISTSKKRPNKQNCRFAQILAKIHQTSAETHARSSSRGLFGFQTNNFYVHTEQENTWRNDWCHFFIEQRFKPIVQRMKFDPHLINDHRKNMEIILLCERLMPHIPLFLASSQTQIPPCLLHGDLSNSNWSVDTNDQIVIFDGSPFYGPYEVDLYTMSEDFIQAYFNAIGGPLEGYEMRFELYNLLRLLRSIIDIGLNTWRRFAFESIAKLLTHCGAWTSPLVRFPCGVNTPIDKIKLPTPIDSTRPKKNAVLIYGGSFCPIHFNHLAMMDLLAETLEKAPYEFEILGGYFCPSSESWIKKKLAENHLPNAYRESLLLLATEGTRWMVDRSYSSSNKYSENIIEAIRSVYGQDFEITAVHVCGIDAIQANVKRVSTQYPLVIVDRSGYDGELLWQDYLQTATAENRERSIWISPWIGQTMSSTMIRNILSKSNDNNEIDIREKLQTLLPSSCIDYILEYKLGKWFKSIDVS